MIFAIDAAAALDAAKDEEMRRGRELLYAAQTFYEGGMKEDDFMGAVCRYGSAWTARKMLLAETKPATPKN